MRYFQIYAVYAYLGLLALTAAPVLGLNDGEFVYSSDLAYAHLAQADAFLAQLEADYLSEYTNYWYSTPFVWLLSIVLVFYETANWPFIINTVTLCCLIWVLSGLVWQKVEADDLRVRRVSLYLILPVLIVLLDFLWFPFNGSDDSVLLLYCGLISLYFSGYSSGKLCKHDSAFWLAGIILFSPILHPFLLILSATLVFLETTHWTNLRRIILTFASLVLFALVEWNWLTQTAENISGLGLLENALFYLNSTSGILVLTSVVLVWCFPNAQSSEVNKRPKLVLILTPLLIAQPVLLGFGMGRSLEGYIELLALLMCLEVFYPYLKKAVSKTLTAATLGVIVSIFATEAVFDLLYLPFKANTVREVSLQANAFSREYFPYPVVTNRPGVIAWNNLDRKVFGLKNTSQQSPKSDSGLRSLNASGIETPVYEIYFGEMASRNLPLPEKHCAAARLVSDRDAVSNSEAMLLLLDSSFEEEFFHSLEQLEQQLKGNSRIQVIRCQKR